MPTGRRLLLVACISAATLVGATMPAHATVTLSSGHVDGIDVDSNGSSLTVQLLDATVSPAVERNPADVVLNVVSAAKKSVPSDPRFSFLGAPNDPVWILPETERSGVLWLGWNATEVPGTVSGLHLQLTSVSGPTGAALIIYTTNSSGDPTVLFNSTDGLPDSMSLSPGAHTHANWALKASGTYTVGFTVYATGIPSASGTYTFTVQP